MPHYLIPVHAGLDRTSSLGDGSTINLKWYRAYPDVSTNSIAYNIYYSTNKDHVFTEFAKYVSIDGSLEANIINLTPGQEYFFSIRPVEYDPTFYNLNNLPIAYDNLRYYPYSLLRNNIGSNDLIIPLLDVAEFPTSGVILAGVELIQYTAIDAINNNLLVASNTVPPNNAYIIDQNGSTFSALNTNVGNGTLTNVSLVNTNTYAATWKVQCIGFMQDVYGNTVPGSERFVTFSSNGDRGILDQFGNPVIWLADGLTRSNGTLNLAIQEGSAPYTTGDSFLINVGGSSTGNTTYGRGYNNTIATMHTVSGFDGTQQWRPEIYYYVIGESNLFDRIFACQSRFEYPNYSFTLIDGYKQVTKDILSTDLSSSDAENVGFPMYDYSGYHRTDPVLLLNGTCVGSYILGRQGCIDGYGNYNIINGPSVQDQALQREEILLSTTGRPATLIKRVQTGIVCSCYLPSSEYPDDRCPLCYGCKFVIGYEQYFNPRRSDGRIMVRAGPTDENLKMYEAGLESELPLSLWTLTVPTIKTRDIIVLYDIDNPDNEEFRYEVTTVGRNNFFLSQEGMQSFKVLRIRKFDPAYQVRIFKDTSMFPSELNTTVGMAIPGIPPHTHTIVVNENIQSITQINQTTGISQAHNHQIVDGKVMPVLSHSHEIIL